MRITSSMNQYPFKGPDRVQSVSALNLNSNLTATANKSAKFAGSQPSAASIAEATEHLRFLYDNKIAPGPLTQDRILSRAKLVEEKKAHTPPLYGKSSEAIQSFLEERKQRRAKLHALMHRRPAPKAQQNLKIQIGGLEGELTTASSSLEHRPASNTPRNKSLTQSGRQAEKHTLHRQTLKRNFSSRTSKETAPPQLTFSK